MLTCWFYRRMISQCLDTDLQLRRGVRNHLHRCPACRRFYETCAHISEQLAAESIREKKTPSPFLREKILVSLNESHARGPRETSRADWAWATSVAALAVLLVCVVFILHRQSSVLEVSPGVSSQQGVSNASGLLAVAAQLPTEDKLREWSMKLDQPLEAELRSVLHDAQSALDLLAHNFLPESLSPPR